MIALLNSVYYKISNKIILQNTVASYNDIIVQIVTNTNSIANCKPKPFEGEMAKGKISMIMHELGLAYLPPPQQDITE